MQKNFCNSSRRAIIYCMILLIGLGVLLGGVLMLNTPTDSGEYGEEWTENGGPVRTAAAQVVNFPEVNVGYTTLPKATVIHRHQVKSEVYIQPAVSNTNDFSISPNSRQDLPKSSRDNPTITTLVITARRGLTGGTHTTEVSWKGDCGCTNPKTITLTLKVNSPPAALLVSPTYLTFGPIQYGATTPAGKLVTVSNIGGSPTGNLTISQTNSSAFKLGATSITSLAAGKSTTFLVTPTATTTGIHSTNISIGNATVGTKQVTANFQITAQPPAALTVNPTSLNFGIITQGTAAPPQNVNILNSAGTGAAATGELSVTKSGSNPNNFSVSKTSISSLSAGSATTISVYPLANLPAGTYSANIIIGNATVGTRTVYVSVTVRSFGISLTGNHEFPAEKFGYTTRPPAHTAEIKNTGSDLTGSLAIEIIGANSGSFELEKLSVANISPSGSSIFTVQPHTGLAAGKHTATIRVKAGVGNNNDIGLHSFDVSFYVRTYGITLSPTDHSFGEASAGYSRPAEKTVTVTNKGNQPSGTLTISLSGANPDNFTITKTSLPSITTMNGTATFGVYPKTLLPSGLHSAEVIVRSSDANVESQKMTVRFHVAAPNIDVNVAGAGLDSSGSYLFPAMDVGYMNPPDPYSVVLTNTGNQASAQLTVTLSGEGGSSFVLTGTPVSSIPVASNATFTVQPKPSLAAGTYIGTVTLQGTGVLIQFNVRFDVRSYGISLSKKQVNFGRYYFEYDTPPPAETIIITNTGNQPTGTLTASLGVCTNCGTNPNTCFSISSLSPSSISGIGGQTSFTIRPKPDLAGGDHTATVTIHSSEAKIPSQTVDISFFVKVLSMSLTPTVYDFGIINQGYTAQDILSYTLTARVTNTGNTETEDLSVDVMGVYSDSFEVSITSISSIKTPGGWVEFTVKPKLRLAAGKHTASIVVAGEMMDDKEIEVKIHVKSQNMEVDESVDFGIAREGYTNPPDAYYVTIKNTGVDPTGDLTVSFVNESFGTFSLSDYTSVSDDTSIISSLTIPSIASGETRTFPIQPWTELTLGAHFAKVKVSNADGSLASQFYALFEIQISKIYLSNSYVSLPHTAEGYSPASLSRIVTVYSNGTAASGPLTVSFIEGDTEAFALPRTSISSILPGGRATFIIQPSLGLEGGSYSVILMVSGEFVEPQYCEISFYVGGFGIQLNRAGLNHLVNGRKGYYTPEEFEVIVKNVGDNPTGLMTAELKGDYTKFMLGVDTTYGSIINLASINTKGGTTSFNVSPVIGLDPGRYNVTVEVGGNNVASQSFDITFKVFRAGCDCEDIANPNNVPMTAILCIIAMLGLAFLLWLGMRPLPLPPADAQEIALGKEEEELSNLLLLTNTTKTAIPQQAYVPPPPPPQKLPLPQPRPNLSQRTAPTPPRTSLTDQILNSAKAKVAESTAQRTSTPSAGSTAQRASSPSAATSTQQMHNKNTQPLQNNKVQQNPTSGQQKPQ